jgi:hypothetical protein
VRVRGKRLNSASLHHFLYNRVSGQILKDDVNGFPNMSDLSFASWK